MPWRSDETFRLMKPLKRIVVTGGAGQVAYSLLFMIAKGDFLGPDQPFALHLLDLPEIQKNLEGVAMELEDCAFPLLREIKIGHDLDQMFNQVDFAFLIGAKPRMPGMERKDLLVDSGKIFLEQGRSLNRVASRDVRTLVVANPCNTNCLIALHQAPDLSPNQFFAMTRLDQNRAVYQIARHLNTPISEIEDVTIWGNHSSTQVVDFVNAKVRNRPALEMIDRQWGEEELFPKVQKRGAEILNARGKSSAASAAKAALDAMRSILNPTPTGQWFSMGVYTTGNSYGIDPDLVFSFPCQSDGLGNAKIVSNLNFNSFLKEKIAITQKELLDERSMVAHLLRYAK